VAPGVIPFEDIDERGRRMIECTPRARGGKPEEIADAVLYFLRAGNFVTGQTLAVGRRPSASGRRAVRFPKPPIRGGRFCLESIG